MSTVDVAALKAHAEELMAKAIAGEGTVIEQNGRRAVLLPCEGVRGVKPEIGIQPIHRLRSSWRNYGGWFTGQMMEQGFRPFGCAN